MKLQKSLKPMKRYSLLFALLALTMIVMSACSQGSGQSSLTILQVIQNSATAMKGLKSAHNDVNLTMQVNGLAGLSTSVATPGLQLPSNISITLKGSGDEDLVKKAQQVDLTVGFSSISTQFSEIFVGNTAYIKTSQNQWYSIDQSALDQASTGNTFGSFFSGVSIDPNSLLSLIENINITDHGDENVNGQSLRHITANLDKTALEQLVTNDPQLKSTLGTQDMAATLATVKTFNASVDVYIDESQFYVHRTELKISLGGSTNSAIPATTTSIDLQADLSNFNKPVNIVAPTNATPITDPSQLLSGLSGL